MLGSWVVSKAYISGLRAEGKQAMDNTTIHPSSGNAAHQVDIHLWRGPPENLDPDRPVQILVNNGYVVGFSPERLQPVWSAYRVANADDDVDYKRPIHYHDDMRLAPEHRIGRKTFGKIGGVQLNVGHMTPNEVINRQFGRLAQMETFLMSNMSPQYGALNQGVWLKLETAIRAIADEDGKDHMWVIVGPVFGDQPAAIERGAGKHLPIPDAYFCVTIDPFRYPYDTPSSAHIDGFIIPQDAPRSSNPQDYPATLEEIEEATGLRFFSDWARDVPVAMEQQALAVEGAGTSRMMAVLGEKEELWNVLEQVTEAAQPTATTLTGLIEQLQAEAQALESVGRVHTAQEIARLETIQHTLSWLLAAQSIISGESGTTPKLVNLITYKIEDDMEDRLKRGARTACNFWNRFLEPGLSIVIRLGTFTRTGNTIARAYKPWEKDEVRYGKVEFNTKFLVNYTDDEIAATIIHEIGHTLGFGWDEWSKLFNKSDGSFKSGAIRKLSALADMTVELDGGRGTALSHWDEGIFDQELMTGYKDAGEYVLPVTIDMMKLLGHDVVERLTQRTPLDDLLGEVANVVFTRQNEARDIDVDYYEETELMETIPHEPEEGVLEE